MAVEVAQLTNFEAECLLNPIVSSYLSTMRWTVGVLVVLLTKFEAECLLLMNAAPSLASEGRVREEPWSSRRILGDGNLRVSPAGVGCLSFGLDVDEEEGHRMLDLAVDEYGVNLIDTSEVRWLEGGNCWYT